MFTEADHELICSIQERCGVDQTGEIDSETLMAIHETLTVAHRLFVTHFVKRVTLELPPDLEAKRQALIAEGHYGVTNPQCVRTRASETGE